MVVIDRCNLRKGDMTFEGYTEIVEQLQPCLVPRVQRLKVVDIDFVIHLVVLRFVQYRRHVEKLARYEEIVELD